MSPRLHRLLIAGQYHSRLAYEGDHCAHVLAYLEHELEKLLVVRQL